MKKLLLAFALLWGMNVFAQLSFEPGQFIIDLEDYVNRSGNESAKDAVADFVANYNAAKINNAQKITVIKLTNEILNKKLGMPVLEDYLRAMVGLINNNQLPKFDAWQKAAKLTLDGSKDDFIAYVNFSRNVFFDFILAQVGAATWRIDNLELDLDLKGKPALVFKNTNVFCYTQGDTITIHRTAGKYLPADKLWIGNKGMYTWARVGKDSADINAELRSYQINFTSGILRADTAYLTYASLFDKPIAGTILDKPFAQSMGDRSVYPRFESHQRDFKNLPFGKGKLTGAFGLKGKVIIGIGTGDKKAELVFQYKNKAVLKMLSDEFIVRESKISTKKTEMVLYLDKDSIYHPQVEFTYRLTDHFIQIYRTNQGVSQAPFMDYYHNFEIYADEFRWDMENPKIDVDMTNDNEPARFESHNYFRDSRYERIQGILDYNPLLRIKLYVQKLNVKGFSIQDYAANFKSNVSDIRLQMIQLHDLGHVTFDLKKDYVTVNRKLYDYVNAHQGRTDYDAIAFFSVIKRYPNASISLINNDLVIQGVPKFTFSDSQNVYVIPQDQILTIKKNRAMDFSGKIRAGKAEFFGSGFAFDYTMFQVRLNNVDSMKFFYRDETTGKDLPIKSVLQDVYGTLTIDHPANKSGRKKIPGYPIFKSDKASNVYYDKPSTQYGVYDRTKFYFEVDPFTLDSLTELNFKTLTLPGTLYAGNIVPNFRYEVSLQPDQSLGFVKEKFNEGYPMYGGKGRGFVALSLSDEGFFGNGDLRYVASTTTSDKFLFLLDSMNTTAKSFVNDRTETFPSVSGENVYEHWMPYQDSMMVTPISGTLALSEGRAKLIGTMIVTPTKMGARGTIKIEEAELTSNDFWLKPDNVLADSSTFKVKRYDNPDLLAFHSENVTSNVDLTAKRGDFVFHNQGVNSHFDYNMYVGSFQSFVWSVDKRMLDFAPYQRDGRDASYLLSVRKMQDSLRFTTGQTLFNLNDFTLTAKKVPYIRIADGFVFADSSQVTIGKEAEMKTLFNSRIIADTINKYHTIEKCNITIFGRFNIQADGVYQYTDRSKKVQQFFLNIIKVDEITKRIIGKTAIPDSANFSVGNKIRFKGIANLKSNLRNLEYEGFFLTVHELPRPKSDWFRGTAVIDPDSVFIGIEEQITNEKRQAMMVGVNISNDSSHVYPLFFTRKRNASDAELMRVNGTLTYDNKLGVFKMGDAGRMNNTSLVGNYMELSEAKKQTYYDGKFNMGFDGGKFDFFVGGNAVYSLKDTSFKMNVLSLLDFPLPSTAMRIMFDSINAQSGSAKSTELDIPMIKTALMQHLKEPRNIKRVVEELDDKSIRLVNELEKLFFFSHIQMVWDQPTRTLVSEGLLSLNSIDKFKIERKLIGRLQIKKVRQGDEFTLYLEAPEGSWYYFRYQRGVMYTIASDPLYNQYIKDNMDKVSKKDDKYDLRQANIGERNKLVRAIRVANKK